MVSKSCFTCNGGDGDQGIKNMNILLSINFMDLIIHDHGFDHP